MRVTPDRTGSLHLKMLTIVLTAATLASPVSAGEVYKWVDSEGVVHYSDQKPSDRNASRMGISTTSSRPPASEPSSQLQQQVERLEENQELEAIRARQKNEEEEARKARQERCEAARRNLQQIETTTRLRVEGEDGELRFLTPEEILEQKKQAETAIQESCEEG